MEVCRYYQLTETGFYYLQSRYYDPKLGRFINADSYASTGQDFLGYNMFAYSNNNPINKEDSTGTYPMIIGDDNNNGAPDYLEIRWYRMTIRAKKQLSNIEIAPHAREDGVAVDCKVPFKKFEETKSNGQTHNLLDDQLYLYALCKEIEVEVRKKEKECQRQGQTLSGSMSFDHIYQELSYHYWGYSTFPEGSSFYESCRIADLNYDENRVLCYPMYLIPVPVIAPGISTYELP